ncbi:YqgE/AlgH family protein [Sphingomonas sp. ST-64]|uniref:UPF0301 protein ABS767_16720 n=1 Tax=Sphingomonas plantiphila TaxID=3163295 RepID=A0ABW8YQP6_9SPHN
MEESAYLTGQILLALPGIGDPRFERAAIAMCAHDAEGALGIGIGHRIDGLGLHELLSQFEIEPGAAPDAPVHFGGPVEPRRGFVVHSTDWSGQDTIDVAGRWALSGTVDVLRAIADGSGPTCWLVALGYAGWGEGQLDAEMTRHGWFNVPGDAALLYGTEPERRWEQSFATAGIDPRMLASGGGTA